MSDTIIIRDLLLRTIIGVNPEERDHRQDVVLTLHLQTDLRPAGRSDAIDDTVNYRTICKQVIELVENSQFQLVERLAEAVAALCLSEPRITAVRVQLDKPGALRFARTVGVDIERRRDKSG